MRKLYIMCGVAFSGKSILANRIAEDKNAILVSQDDIWQIKKKELDLDLDSDEHWEKVQQISRARIREFLMTGSSVVYDDLALRHKDRELLRVLAQECGAEAVLVYLDTPRSIQQERQVKNLHTKERHDVPEHIIEWGLAELEMPSEKESPFIFTPDTNITDWLESLP